MKHLIFLLATILLCSIQLRAQNGTVRGTVIDDKNAEAIIGATVRVEGTSQGTVTDIDGSYNLSLAPGTYKLTFTFLSYAGQTVSDIVVTADQVTVIDVRMLEASEQIQIVEVTAERTRNNESAMITLQKTSVTVLDAISAQTISKTGDNNTADALKRVPGVSIEGGKYVYVRGLGDRYTKTMLNGMDIPGLDPDRNTVQMDVFPTSLIDNLIVYKTFTPDLPGDFTGGVVDITIKDFPDRRIFEVGAGLGFNTATTFKKDFILYEGGKLDWLGIDNGTRKLPFSYDNNISSSLAILEDPKLEDYTRSFSNQLEAEKRNNFLNQSYYVSYGNQYNKEKRSYGFNFGLTYRNSYQFFEKAEYGEHLHDVDPNYLQFDEENFRTSKGALGINNVLWSGMLGGAIKSKKSRLTLQLFHTQNGEKAASEREQIDGIDQYESVADILSYSQRSISNVLVTGRHKLEKMEIEWKNSFTYSIIKDPDLRVMQFAKQDSVIVVETGGSSQTNRYFRDLNEINENFRVDFMVPFKQWSGLNSKVKFGVYETYKTRSFKSYVATLNSDGFVIENNADDLLLEENIWTPTNTDGTYVTGYQDKANTFDAFMNIAALYAMHELPLHEKLNLIYGVRLEKADLFFTGQRQQVFNPETDKFDNEHTLNELDVLPSFNLIYTPVENMNVRLTYSRTVARPTFKEKSLAQIFDPITEVTFIGNLNVEETHIDNLDLRWEYFFASGEMVSFSGFFKNFNDPIEIVAFSPVTPRDITPRNIDNAKAFGLELEVRKNFKFIHEKLEGLAFSANLSWIKSTTKMDSSEINGRNQWKKNGYTIDDTRAMFGQSPFLVNTSLSYTHPEIGLTATIAYNVQGKRLSIVGAGRTPDVYDMPFNSLNVKITQAWGKNKQYRLSFQAENLVGDDNLRQYEAYYDPTPAVFQRLVPGRSFSLGFSYVLR
ncbi:MAG: TonB-dependent receptor [Chitinophagales bacterium]|nr:TonB-dependent receptor [Chitinophagales bacterium]